MTTKMLFLSRKDLIAPALAASLAVTSPAHALFGIGDIVYDPSNHAENLLTAARTLTMLNQQLQQLQNEARMILNMEQHLRRLDITRAGELRLALNQINLILRQAESIAYTVTATDLAWRRLYPERYDDISGEGLVSDAQDRWSLARAAYGDSLKIQAEILERTPDDIDTLNDLLAASQSSVGGLQAAQAGNELLGLTVKELMATRTLAAAHYRAQGLDAARDLMTREEARARQTRFMGDAQAYSGR